MRNDQSYPFYPRANLRCSPPSHLQPPPNHNPNQFVKMDNGQGPVFHSTKKLEHMNCIMEETLNMGGLYLGDVISTIKPGILESGNIAALLTCNFEENNYTRTRTDLKLVKKNVDARDSLDFPIDMLFSSTFDFIEENRKEKRNVLVNCHAGVSRSGTLVCAYLMNKYKWTAERTLNFVRNKRERVKPNEAFWNKLLKLEKQILGDYGPVTQSLTLKSFDRQAFDEEIKKKNQLQGKQIRNMPIQQSSAYQEKYFLKKPLSPDFPVQQSNPKSMLNQYPSSLTSVKSTPSLLTFGQPRFAFSDRKPYQDYHLPLRNDKVDVSYDRKQPFLPQTYFSPYKPAQEYQKETEQKNFSDRAIVQNPEARKLVFSHSQTNMGQQLHQQTKIDPMGQQTAVRTDNPNVNNESN